MRVYSFRLRPARVLAALCAAAVLVLGGRALFSGGEAVPVFGLFKKGVPGQTQEQRMDYIASYGWQAESTPLSESEVLIPQEFDELYDAYNAIQKAQGFDLSKYRGKQASKYCYLLTNYPGEEQAAVTLLVCRGKIIGADISGAGADSFMRGMEKPKGS